MHIACKSVGYFVFVCGETKGFSLYHVYHHLLSTNLPKTTKVCSSQCTTKVISWTQRDLLTLQSPKLVRLTLIPGLSLIVCQVPTIHCTTLYTSPLPQGHHFFIVSPYSFSRNTTRDGDQLSAGDIMTMLPS